MSFECSICNKLFSSKQRLEYHTKRVCKQKELNCMICNKVFTTKQNLDYHVTNKVCRLADDTTSKMFEMFDMIKELQKRVSILEQDNKELKESLKTKNTPTSDDEDAYKRLCAFHIKTLSTPNGGKKIIFQDDKCRYATVRLSKSISKLTIWASIDCFDCYQPLIDKDIDHLQTIFKHFSITRMDKINVNRSIYSKCILQFGKNLTNTTNVTNVTNVTNDKTHDSHHSLELNRDIDSSSKYFIENNGVECFIGTDIKRGSMESYKYIYKNQGENELLEQAPQRFLHLWEVSKHKVMEYFMTM